MLARHSVVVALLCLIASRPAQAQAPDDAALAARVMAALGGKQLPGGRLGLVDDKAPMCPSCGKRLREVALWEGRGGIDSGPSRVTALVCLADQLFTVRSRAQGMGDDRDAGPFSLPAAGAPQSRTLLPWGARPLPDESTKLTGELSALRSRDGAVLVADGDGGRLWAKSGNRTLFEERGAMGVTAWALSDDGKHLAFARSQGPLRVIALASGKEAGRFRMGPVNVLQIVFEPGGKRLLFVPMSGGGDSGTVELGSITGGKSKTLSRVEAHTPTAFAWLEKHGTVAMSTFDGAIRALALDGSGERWSMSFEQPVEALAAAPDGSGLCAAGNGGLDAVVLGGANGSLQHRVRIAPMFATRQERGCRVTSSNDSRSYAWVLSDGRIACKDVRAPDALRLSPGSTDLRDPDALRVSFTEDGKDLVTATVQGKRLQWQIEQFPVVH